MNRTEIESLLHALDEAETGTLILEPQSAFNGGIIGFDGKRLIYEYFSTIDSMVDQFEGEEGALEWFSYNTLRSLPYMGEKAPIIWDGLNKELLYPEPEDNEDFQIECYQGLQNSLRLIQYKENNGEQDGDQ
jgi:hypothetical protein